MVLSSEFKAHFANWNYNFKWPTKVVNYEWPTRPTSATFGWPYQFQIPLTRHLWPTDASYSITMSQISRH